MSGLGIGSVKGGVVSRGRVVVPGRRLGGRVSDLWYLRQEGFVIDV
jgi:hypothetical protein